MPSFSSPDCAERIQPAQPGDSPPLTAVPSSSKPVADAAAGDPGALIAAPGALADLLTRLPAGPGVRCALDTEADSLHSYREKLCLIQLACGDEKVIIDPLNIPDLTPFMQWLEGIDIWMHGADFDMTLLRRTFGSIPVNIFDTQTAARLCGERQFGLAHIVEKVFGVTLSKQSQRADWGRRPLPQKMIDYALNDVRYILPLADHYLSKLRELGRESWFLESCRNARESVLARPAPDPDSLWRIPGSGKLRPAGLNYLRALWHWRDGESRRLDRPAFKVIGNAEILAFAEALEAGRDVRLPERFPPACVRRFLRALREAREAPEETWPKRPLRRRHERNPDFERQFERLRETRDRVAAELDLDPSLIASRGVLEAIAFNPDAAHDLLLGWQRGLLGIGDRGAAG